MLATLTASKVALLLTGKPRWLDLPRSQARMMRTRGEVRDGVFVVPIRYDGRRKWHHFTKEPASPYVQLWHMSQSQQDWDQVERLAELERKRGELDDPDLGWAYFVQGKNPQFPVEAFRRDLEFVQRRLARILNEHGDPETWYDAHWLSLDPMPTDNLVRLTIGGLPVHKRGEMLHSFVRYFDFDKRQAGPPQGVAALVTGIAPDSVTVELVNTNLFDKRRLIVQGGAYGEHRIRDVAYQAAASAWFPGSNPPDAGEAESRTTQINGTYFRVDLEPGTGITLKIGLDRFVSTPRYAFPWDGRESPR